MNKKIKNVNSPLEEIMEQALKKAGIKYKAQYTMGIHIIHLKKLNSMTPIGICG
ncbi:hypothetical protein P9F15_17460 [Bacillus cereus]|nr:hypothetical protein [Bacillus cereus]